MSVLSGATVFVTGAGGFLGRYIVTALNRMGVDVRAHIGPKGAFAASPLKSKDIFEGDICSPDSWEQGLTGAHIVVHLAGMPSVAQSFAEPQEYARVHVMGTACVLHAAEKAGVRRVVYVSSAEVYGSPTNNPISEEGRLQPRSPYGAAKIGAEKIVEAWQCASSRSALILRPFSIYGPGAPAESLIAQLIDQLQKRTEVSVADLRPVRDYCFVGDVARAVVQACAASIDFGVFNIGSMRGHSVEQVAMALLAAMNKSGTIIERADGRRPSDVFALIADNRRADALLNWRPTVTLEEGLRMTARVPQLCDF